MSKNTEPKRGDYKSLLRWALGRGWEEGRHARHIILVWPATGRKCTVSCTSSDHRAWLNTYKTLLRIEQGADG